MIPAARSRIWTRTMIRPRWPWPLVLAGALKAIYDVLMLAMFAKVRPPEEVD